MKTIQVDASDWTSTEDFYDAVLPLLGAPDWHGRNLNALIDSILVEGVNSVAPPYVIVIRGTAALKPDILDYIESASFNLAQARAETRDTWDRDMDARIEIEA